MIVKPDLLKPEDPLAEHKGRFARLPKDELRAISRKGALALGAKRHKFTPSEQHRGGVIRGAYRTMEARAKRR